ncbi:MAG TPA: hypothetical protein VNF46_01800 [Gammaproteobacteria bacterium]|nr:hypothetical protein [Gammaproteobacteria bacterium]
MLLRLVRLLALLSAMLAVSAHAAGKAVPSQDATQNAGPGYVTLDPGLKRLRDDFNANAGDVRLVFIVSGTCPGCLRGMEDMGKALSPEQANPQLRTYVVYIPKLGAQAKDIQPTVSLLPSKYVSRYWDPAGVSGRRFGDTLEIGQYAWDVWMIYGRGQRWDKELPPKPDFWMHQLYGLPNSSFLNADTFAKKVKTYLLRSKTAAAGNSDAVRRAAGAQ